MQVAVYHSNRDVRVETRPAPVPGPGELLLRVRASGICGSDVMEWYRIKKAPLVLGHEVAGTVEAVGPGTPRFRPGDRVVVSHHVPCNTCRYCLDGQHTVCETLHTTSFDPGGFAELVRVPAINVDRGVLGLPDRVSFEAASFVEPLGCVVRGQRLARMRPGKTVAVLGSGISGILHVALARTLGAGRILATDRSPARLAMARRFGAAASIGADEDVPSRIRQENQGRGADLVIVCAGALAAFRQALEAVDRGGTVLCFATPSPGEELPVPVNDFWRLGVTLLPSYAAAPGDLVEALDLIAAGLVPVVDMITHRLPLDRIQEGFRLVAAGGDSLKVIVYP